MSNSQFAGPGSSRDNNVLFKIVLVGDSKVGKTCTSEAYVPHHTATIGADLKPKTIELDGKQVKLQIWDTAGDKKFCPASKSYFRGAKGFVLMYDITDQTSFDNLTDWLTTLEEFISRSMVVLLVGNKCDMEFMQVVPRERGEQFASQYNMFFLETSAKTGFNIDKLFETLAQSILEKQLPAKEESKTRKPPRNIFSRCN